MDTLKYFLAGFVALFVGCSSNSQVAGNSAETGSPELAGILMLDGGKPAAHARVQCVPGDYNILAASKAEQVLPSAFETETDENGNYEFDTIPSGSFSLEAFHQESGQMLLLQNLNAEEDEPLAVNDTLQGPGTVKLLVSGAFRENQSGEAIVIGTTIRRSVSVQNGKIVVDSLPADTFELIVYMDGMSPFGFKDVSVKPEETTVWGDSVTYTLKAPLALPEEIDSLGTVVSDFPLAIRLTDKEISFDSAEVVNGRWEAVRISQDGNRSKKLPITQTYFDASAKETVFWVRVDSLNVSDSLELHFDNTMNPAYAKDVFPTNRSYSLVWHFDSGLAPVDDGAEKGYFEGLPTGVVAADGVVGRGVELDEGDVIVVENSSAADSSRKVNLNYDGSGYFCFSVWVKLESLESEQTIFKKSKEYALRYVPEKGFVVDLWVPDSSSDSVKYAWLSGMSDIKAGEWVYVAFSRHTISQSNFYVNDRKIETDPEQIAWTGVRDVADFEVGGFTGTIDELMLGSCYRDDDWTRLTYLNQRPENYWPALSAR
ncbi:Concanavalin A-like lectin/glucanases superfamily protein [Fibrobacter sp. UWB15]|uniref:LamG-like jellyroll fold domain-containing protein n=1 Tax=unclassified Fibrobacter TaxID=2634177 RepID=UPI0009234BCC|nr:MULTISPECIES: LamG-like jellyroll fold domain-containing protein [unclassified Fibrobacter]PWJ62583.1 concanavalin A-like lectin/glucanase superfamily protein [Fibrobacter sp. UWB6]SHG48574.1 Concanavalin A-like lectin/glucanases superfamily protein [Fibrobacter sp. UWB8]SMG27466.1 Concanavalin A-like lectin/glucanases superfamily protein [Fibrobacter sp. UWB15]